MGSTRPMWVGLGWIFLTHHDRLGQKIPLTRSMHTPTICISALQSQIHFLDNILSKPSSNIFRWFRKPTRIASKDSSVIIYKLFEDEIIENAKTLLEDFNSTKEGYKPKKTESKNHWWMLSGQTELEKIGGPQFSAWTREYVPAYRLQIDTDILEYKIWGLEKIYKNSVGSTSHALPNG